MLLAPTPTLPSADIVSEVLPENLDRIFYLVEDAGWLYPGFHEWFYGKVAPGIGWGDRAVFIARGDSGVKGVAIAKRSAMERKLCTLWITDHARGDGIARSLADATFDWLGTRMPLFTVPEERLPEFRGLLNGWCFSLEERKTGFYRPERTEFVFNGRLAPLLNG